MRIGIIGMGVSGISVLREWTKKQEDNPDIEITVFNEKETLGTGVPYQKDDKCLILNQPAELATIIPEKKDDFVDWVEENYNDKNVRLEYLPRPVFGEYLQARMESWLYQSNARVVEEKVSKVHVLPDEKFKIITQSTKQAMIFDVVHLCIGNFDYDDPYNLTGHPAFIGDPFPVEKKLSQFPKGAKIGVLGTGLTAIDIFRYLYLNRPDLKLSFYSKTGRFKSVRKPDDPIEYIKFTKEKIEETKAKNYGFISLDTYLDWFQEEIAHQNLSLKDAWVEEPFGSLENLKEDLNTSHGIQGVQTLLLGMDPILSDLWMALKENDKKRFIDEYFDIWDKLRSSFPVESAEMLVEAWDEDKIEVYDQLKSIKQKEDSFVLELNHNEPHSVDYIINATGTNKILSFNKTQIPLLRQLLNERIIQPEEFGGVQIHKRNLSAMSQRYGILNNFKVHGPLISGIQFGNNSIDTLSESAYTAVQSIITTNK